MTKKSQIGSEPSDKNELRLDDKISSDPEVSVKFYDWTNKPIDNFAQLFSRKDDNKIDIFLDFFVEEPRKKIGRDERVVTYLLIDDNSKAGYESGKKQALLKHIRKHKIDKATDSRVEISENENEVNNLKCVLSKVLASLDNNNEDKVDIEVIASDGGRVTIAEKNIRMFAYFNLPKRTEYDELKTFPSPPKKPESFWTSGKIILAVVVIGIIAALVFFYRKKIWLWIKREDKTKKKEQVEIF